MEKIGNYLSCLQRITCNDAITFVSYIVQKFSSYSSDARNKYKYNNSFMN